MTIIPVVVGAFDTVSKVLENKREELEIRMRIETLQTRALLRLARILRRGLETFGDLVSFRPY